MHLWKELHRAQTKAYLVANLVVGGGGCVLDGKERWSGA